MIHDVQVQALQIGDVAWDVEGHDLASAAGKDLVAAGEPFQDRAALRRPVLVTDDIRVCFKLPHRDRQRGDRLLLVVRNGSDALKLSDQRGEMGFGGGHGRRSLRDAGAQLSLSHRCVLSDPMMP